MHNQANCSALMAQSVRPLAAGSESPELGHAIPDGIGSATRAFFLCAASTINHFEPHRQ